VNIALTRYMTELWLVETYCHFHYLLLFIYYLSMPRLKAQVSIFLIENFQNVSYSLIFSMIQFKARQYKATTRTRTGTKTKCYTRQKLDEQQLVALAPTG
jgi:hypothetical protein